MGDKIESNRFGSNRIEYKKSIKTTTQKTLSVITLDEDKLFIINKYNVKSRALSLEYISSISVDYYYY